MYALIKPMERLPLLDIGLVEVSFASTTYSNAGAECAGIVVFTWERTRKSALTLGQRARSSSKVAGWSIQAC